MARDSERSINPAQQQRKLDKAKALKKSKAELQARRNEKLARRNPDRLQRQIDDLKALEESGDIKPREKAILAELERDIRAVRKAREALGENGPSSSSKRPEFGKRADHNVLGKRRHDGQRKDISRQRDSSGSETDDSVRRIPMPEDSPPPIPRQFRSQNANVQKGESDKNNGSRPAVPVVESKTTYESAPQVRDLRKEAVNRFVPNIVRQKRDAVQGVGGLLEPEELDKLEAAGYTRQGQNKEGHSSLGGADRDSDPDAAKRLAEEEERFQHELGLEEAEEEQDRSSRGNRHVEIEEVEDEDG